MRLFKNIYIIGFITLLIVSCKKTTVVDAANYVKYVDNPENGLVQEYKNEDKALKITTRYKTPEYLAIKEIGPTAFHPDSILKLAKEFEGGYHLGFTISSMVSGYDVIKEKLSPKEYLDRVTYLSGSIRDDFKLLVGLDTVACSIAHFERNYNISPNNNFMLVFPYDKTTNEDLTLIYDDKIFGEGKLEFKIKYKNIKNTPKLL
jgi:hypothetical protein